MSLFDLWRRVRIAEERIASYRETMERTRDETTRYQAQLFLAWKTMAGQTRGLQRQRRLINRLRADIAKLKASSEPSTGKAP